MTSHSRLGKQIEEIVSTLAATGAPFALIGGLALAPYKVVRATQDLEDIRALIAANRESLDLGEVREYFRLFGKESLLQDLIA